MCSGQASNGSMGSGPSRKNAAGAAARNEAAYYAGRPRCALSATAATTLPEAAGWQAQFADGCSDVGVAAPVERVVLARIVGVLFGVLALVLGRFRILA